MLIGLYTKKYYKILRLAENFCLDYDENQLLFTEFDHRSLADGDIQSVMFDKLLYNRQQLSQALVQNLQLYGNIESVGIIGRPYNADTKSPVPFCAANYLRLAAAPRRRLGDPRWFSGRVLKNNGMTVQPGVEPVQIE